ncbi:MAG: hypothetical protein EOM23_03950 [Candidatus Moranbacteria bacterium]|nr:hypothetical protein [Candidatus Moranbacteria bacterium]
MVIKRKKAFTLIEVLMSSGILLMVVGIGISILHLMSLTLYEGQIETANKSSLNDTVYYISREIQSAQGIKITEDGKNLKIMQRGSEDYNLVYTVTKNYPVGYLAFKEKRLLDLEYETSGFSYENGRVKIAFSVYKNNIKVNQIPQDIFFEILPRSESVVMEVTDI